MSKYMYKNQDIYLFKSYTSVSSKPSKTHYFTNIYIYIIYRLKNYFPLNENIDNIHLFVVCPIMHNSTGCEHAVQNDKLNFAIFSYIFIFKIKKIVKQDKYR